MGLRRKIFSLTASVLACALAPTLAAATEPHACTAPGELTRLAQPLPRTGDHLVRHEALTIVALGSSSTYGAGASSSTASYPSRLEVELRKRFPDTPIKVLNRGVNGEEVPDMLKRFTDSVLKEKPDLVLWQLGTNSVLRDHPVGPTSPLILDGVRRLRNIEADVVMIDPQYAPRVIAKPDAEGMVRLISELAKEANVDLIQRFAMMRWWHDHEHMDFSEFVSSDGLHMNDWSYACLAKLISGSVVEAATRNMVLTGISNRRSEVSRLH